jgi:hypothetical protein
MGSAPSLLSSETLLRTVTLLQVFPPQVCWAGAATPAFSSCLVYLQFCEGLPLPHSLELRVPHPLCCVSFCCCLLFSFFSLFSLGGGQSVQGSMLIWPRVVCGSTMCLLVHLVVCFSQAGKSWRLVAWEPSWFLHSPWSGDAMHGLGCVALSEFYLFLVVFPARCIFIISPRFYFRNHAFCFLPLVATLGMKLFLRQSSCLAQACLEIAIWPWLASNL